MSEPIAALSSAVIHYRHKQRIGRSTHRHTRLAGSPSGVTSGFNHIKMACNAIFYVRQLERQACDDFPTLRALAKSRSGIPGLDEVTGGGLPSGRPSLICGAAGAGKTLFAMSFLVAGATQFGEPGVFISFEETDDELRDNVASLGYDLAALVAVGRLAIDHVRLERGEIEEAGQYDLDGLFVRLGHAIKRTGARRIVLDTLEALFTGLSDGALLRAELSRLFRWLKDQGVTAVITAEKGDGAPTRHGLEEYVSDCVIVLAYRVINQVATRRLRVVKYRGLSHGANE